MRRRLTLPSSIPDGIYEVAITSRGGLSHAFLATVYTYRSLAPPYAPSLSAGLVWNVRRLDLFPTSFVPTARSVVLR